MCSFIISALPPPFLSLSLTLFEAFWQFDAFSSFHPAKHHAAGRNDAHLRELAQEAVASVDQIRVGFALQVCVFNTAGII